jgi:hypothetical protein
LGGGTRKIAGLRLFAIRGKKPEGGMALGNKPEEKRPQGKIRRKN